MHHPPKNAKTVHKHFAASGTATNDVAAVWGQLTNDNGDLRKQKVPTIVKDIFRPKYRWVIIFTEIPDDFAPFHLQVFCSDDPNNPEEIKNLELCEVMANVQIWEPDNGGTVLPSFFPYGSTESQDPIQCIKMKKDVSYYVDGTITYNDGFFWVGEFVDVAEDQGYTLSVSLGASSGSLCSTTNGDSKANITVEA